MAGSRVPALLEHHPLAPLTSLGTGGAARWFCAPGSDQEILAALQWARAQGVEVFVLGGGSNLVVADSGFDGLVLQVGSRGVGFEDGPDGQHVNVTAAAGHPWDDLVRKCCDAGLGGLECLSGIPGTVGATPIQNVGAYGQEVAQTLVWVRCLDRQSHEVVRFDNSQCEFGYRDSRFKRRDRGRYVVLEVSFRMSRAGPAAPRYPELAAALGAGATTAKPTAKEVRQAVLGLRAGKSMLLDPNDPNGRSCGSFFVNPVLSATELTLLRARVAPDEPPTYPEAGGHVKVPAAWLIQRAGFARGDRSGNVGLSTKHTLCVVAHGEASSSEVLTWARHIRATVLARCGVLLEPEPQLLAVDF
jgi:UDP-N-acetylmuramate dehydrogenase